MTMTLPYEEPADEFEDPNLANISYRSDAIRDHLKILRANEIRANEILKTGLREEDY